MRPAKQWVEQLREGYQPDPEELVALASAKDIKAIQADALRGAAQISKDFCTAHWGTIGRGQGVRIFADKLAKKLLAEAERMDG